MNIRELFFKTLFSDSVAIIGLISVITFFAFVVCYV